MPVTFADLFGFVGCAGKAAFRQPAGIRAKAHRAAEFVDAFQFAKLVDDAVRRCRIEFGGVRGFESANIAGKLDHHRLHAEADAEVWNLLFACKPDGIDHALNAALAESARHKNAVEPLQPRFALRPDQLLGFNPVDVHA